ncbi:MAG: hypothetical protein ACQETB_10720 [Halobacteriota archaeon]
MSLYRGGSIESAVTIVAVLFATAASMLVKVGLSRYGPRSFKTQIAAWTAVILVAAGSTTARVVFT